MKAVKELEHGLLLNHFGLGNDFYLSLTVMTFFGFGNPDQALNEQEMWPFVQGELGQDAILDMAMPKPRGEVLLWGKCCTPDGKPRPAGQAGFQIGPIRKTLNVFGNRYWRRNRGTLLGITDPEPFTEMPITYDRAFGGPGYDRNPTGKGFTPVVLPSGEEVFPLPNVEEPRRQIGSPSDRPEPAGFGPLDFSWPQRMKKLGTYDNRWFQKRWPFYPEDMDWSYFNTAPDDQQMGDFFNGGDPFVIRGMHRTRPVIEARLPALRHRLFVNQLDDLQKPAGDKTFREVNLRLETVWLFPHAEKGIAIFRGTNRVQDDEALDVLHLYVSTEAMAEAPKTIEHYHQEFIRRLDRKVPVNLAAPMAEARKKLAEAADDLRDLPRKIEDGIARNLGQAPSPVRTPTDVVNQSLALIEKNKKLLDDAETRFLDMKAKYGHFVKVNPASIATARTRLDDAAMKLQALPAEIAQAETDKAGLLKKLQEVGRSALARLDPALAAEKEAELQQILDGLQTKPADPWQENGMRFLERCRDTLQSHTKIMTALSQIGLRRYTIQRHWLGFNPRLEIHDPALWGLPAEADHRENPRELHLLSGLVCPCFHGASLHRIRMRSAYGQYPPPEIPLQDPESAFRLTFEAVVEGSGTDAMAHSSGPGKPFVRVAYELESILLHQELGNFCGVIALTGPDVTTDEDTAKWLKDAPQFLVVLYPESDNPVDEDIEAWRKVWPQAEPLYLPAGTNLFQARRSGLDLWQWVADALRPGIAPDPETKPKEIDLDQPGAVAALVPVIDVKGLIKKVEDSLNAGMQADMDKLEAEKKKGLDIIRKSLEAKGLDLDQAMKDPGKSILAEANPYAAVKEKYAAQFANIRQHLQQRGLMKPEIEQKLAEAERTNQAVLTDAAKRYEDGRAQLEATRAQANAKPPEWAKKLLAQAGIDPDEPAPLRPLSREEVIERHGQGKSLAGKNLAGVDLSGLDLTGIDLHGANLQKTNFSDSKLAGADLTQAIAGEADFSRAALDGAVLVKGIFQKARFAEAGLRSANLSQAMLSEADLTAADLTEARLEKTLLEKAKLPQAKLGGSHGRMGYFLSTDVSGADFSGADLTKAVFLEANVDQARFAGGTIHSTVFLGSKGRQVSFAGADMHNSRILNGSALTESDFTGAQAGSSSWMRSDLSGGDFRGAVLARTLVEECNLAGADLSGVSARQARLTKSDLTGANLQRVNLFQGSLRKSKLVRTDLRGANLYGAEFYRTGVGETRLEGANLKLTKLSGREDLLPPSGSEEKSHDKR